MERDENEERDRYDDRKMDAKDIYVCVCVAIIIYRSRLLASKP